MSKNEQFWMVWNPNGHAPTFRHDTIASARHEAERLARSSPTSKFYVLEAKSVCEKNDVLWRDLENNPEIPF